MDLTLVLTAPPLPCQIIFLRLVFLLYPTSVFIKRAAIAQWIHLRLPSRHTGFESQAYFHLNCSNCIFELKCKKNKYKQKEAGIGPFFKKNFRLYLLYPCSSLLCSQVCLNKALILCYT